MNDLDFLLMCLFQADSGCGTVFKDIQVSGIYNKRSRVIMLLQVERELMKEVKKDHEYLYILLNSRKDRERAI